MTPMPSTGRLTRTPTSQTSIRVCSPDSAHLEHLMRKRMTKQSMITGGNIPWQTARFLSSSSILVNSNPKIGQRCSKFWIG